MYVDDKYEIYENFQGCCECGDVNGVCAWVGGDSYCGPCWDIYQRPKITIVIRTPWLKDGGVILTDDDFDAAITEIQKLRDRAPV